jgi:hypothetical protein
MDIEVQNAVCGFVRKIIADRTNEKIEIAARPELDERNIPVVEELWESPTCRYAIEHTRVEAFEGQIANQSRILRWLLPVKMVLAPRLPGYFILSVREVDLAAARFDVDAARLEIARLVVETAGTLPVGEVVQLRSKRFPFSLQLYLRHKNGSNLVLYTDIEGDPELRRLERICRALDDKCPKLAVWARDGRTSVLALESNDIQLSNAFVIADTLKHALRERDDQPDVIVLVETDIGEMNGWVLKEGDRYGKDVPPSVRGYCYSEGQF